MIESSEISVIVQGAFSKDITPNTIASIRKYLPKAEIILSVWEGTVLPKNLSVDKTIFNKDPGFCYYSDEKNPKKNNVNRQIVSTLSGLKATTKKYTLKIRTDFILTGNNFLNYFDKYKKVNPKWQIFEKKLVACTFFARIPEISKTALHISDLLFFGLTSDILRLFDIPLMPKEYELCFTYSKDNKKKHEHTYTKYCPEQYIFCTFLKKCKMPFKMDNQYDLTKENTEQTYNYFANNFVFLSFGQYNVTPSPSLIDTGICYQDCYTFLKWQNLYKKYVDPNFVMEEKEDTIYKNLLKVKRYHKLSKVLTFAIVPAKKRRKTRKELSNKLAKHIILK